MNEIELKYYPIEALKAADYNPRGMVPEAFQGLKNSLKKFGLVDPLIFNKKTGVLISGHQRLKAAKELGLVQIPVIELELDPNEEKALNVSLNNPLIQGFFSDDINEIIKEISSSLGAQLVEDLNLIPLVLDGKWESDLNEIEKITESRDTAFSVLKIKFKEEDNPDLKAKILMFISENFTGVTVE